MKLAKLIKNIKPSATVEINSIAQQKKAQGIRVYNLSAGEPLVDAPEKVKAAAIDAVNKGETTYPPVAGIPPLREAAANWMNTEYSCTYTATETIVTAGGKFALYALCQALINPKDEVIIISPYWVSYPSLVELFGGKPVIIDTFEEDNWQIDIEEIKQAFTEKTRMIIINSGSNPTGALYKEEDLRELAKFCAEKDILLISDEVYSGLIYDGHKYISCGSFTEYKNNIVVVQSCSKSFAMTGWRIGFAFATEEIIKTISMLQSQTTSGAPTVGQWTALAAIENAKDITPEINTQLQKRRDLFIDTFNLLFQTKLAKPQCALYAFVPISAITQKSVTSLELAKEMLDKANVAAVPGIAFGKEGYIRFSFGAREEEITEALHALYNQMRN